MPLLQHDRIIIKLRPGSEIRFPAQTPKDIPDIIRRIDAPPESALPASQNPLNDFDTREIDIPQRGLEAALVGIPQIDRARLARERTVEIRGRAHDDDAAEIGAVVEGGAQHGFEGGVVLLRGGAVGGAAVGEERGRVAEGLAEEGPAEIGVRGRDVAGHHRGALAAGGVERGGGVVGAVGDGGGGVVQGRGAGEGEGELAQGFGDFEDFGAVDALGVFGGGSAALGDVAGGVI